MLKDLADSKRIDQHIHVDGGPAVASSPIHPKIVSRLFWPTFQATGLVLPGQMARAQQRYAKAFHQFKPDKRLRWLPQIGTVSVVLELEDRTIEAEASPLQAAVADLFSSQGK